MFSTAIYLKCVRMETSLIYRNKVKDLSYQYYKDTVQVLQESDQKFKLYHLNNKRAVVAMYHCTVLRCIVDTFVQYLHQWPV